jgi:hypothetical protein
MALELPKNERRSSNPLLSYSLGYPRFPGSQVPSPARDQGSPSGSSGSHSQGTGKTPQPTPGSQNVKVFTGISQVPRFPGSFPGQGPRFPFWFFWFPFPGDRKDSTANHSTEARQSCVDVEQLSFQLSWLFNS